MASTFRTDVPARHTEAIPRRVEFCMGVGCVRLEIRQTVNGHWKKNSPDISRYHAVSNLATTYSAYYSYLNAEVRVAHHVSLTVTRQPCERLRRDLNV